MGAIEDLQEKYKDYMVIDDAWSRCVVSLGLDENGNTGAVFNTTDEEAAMTIEAEIETDVLIREATGIQVSPLVRSNQNACLDA